MKVCEEHLSILKRGMTYTLTNSDKCEVCKLLRKYGWLDDSE